jgi:hypothetical protein
MSNASEQAINGLLQDLKDDGAQRIFNATRKVALSNPDRNILLRIAKMAEELGEFSAEVLKLQHYKPRKAQEEEELLIAARCEAIDIHLVSYDILHQMQVDHAMLEDYLLNNRLPKWQTGIENFKKQMKYA